MQCACAILPSVACPVLQYFSTLSHKGHDFRKRYGAQNALFKFSLQILRNIFFSRKTERHMIKMFIVFHVSTRYSCQILIKLEFSRHTFEKQIPNFMKIRPMGAQLFHADRKTNRQT